MMMGRGDGPGAGAAGGPSRHVPVLLAEVGTALDANRGGVFIDGTFGAGGYTRAILDAHPQNKVIAIDRDPDAIAGGEALAAKFKKRLMLWSTNPPRPSSPTSSIITATSGARVPLRARSSKRGAASPLRPRGSSPIWWPP